MIRKGFLIAAGVLCLAGAGFLVYLMARSPRESGPELPPVRMRLAKRLVPEAVRELRAKLPPTFAGAVLLQFQGHRSALDVRKMVRDEIEKSGALRLRELEEVVAQRKESKGLEVKAREWADSLLAAALGKEPPRPDERVSEALRAAKLDGYVGANVFFLEDDAREERLDIVFYANDPDGREIFRNAWSTSIRKSLFDIEYYRLSLAEIGSIWRILLWLVAALVAPVLTFFVGSAALRTENNAWIFTALAAYTAFDGFVALALLGFTLSGPVAFFLLLASLGLGGFYNWAMFTEIKDLF
jgi:hypothetical protein